MRSGFGDDDGGPWIIWGVFRIYMIQDIQIHIDGKTQTDG